MNIEVIGRKVNLKDSFKERVDKKLAKFSRLFHEDASATVTVTVDVYKRQRLPLSRRRKKG